MSTVNGFCERCNSFRKRYCNGDRNTCLRILFDRIEVLQQENDVIKDSFTTAQKAIGSLQQENEQLKAQVARIPDICKWWDGWSCTAYQSDEMKCPHCCPNWEGDNKYAVYHNPADVEALRKAREEVQKALDNYEVIGEHEYDISGHLQEALAEIDKVIGGKENV